MTWTRPTTILLLLTISCAGTAGPASDDSTGGTAGDEAGGKGGTMRSTGGAGPARGGTGGSVDAAVPVEPDASTAEGGSAGSGAGGAAGATAGAGGTDAGGMAGEGGTMGTGGAGPGGSGGTPGIPRQGAGPTLYTQPTNKFVEQPTGENVVTVNDTSGTIAGLQAAIDGARAANANSVIVIRLQATTYAVSSASLVLGAHMAMVGTGATIRAASPAVTVPLVSISSGATKVSVAGGTYDGNGAHIRGIYGTGVSRVNIDKVVVKGCLQDGIQLIGNGNAMYDSELVVTRSECSGASGHAGISIQQCTMAYLGDNVSHDNLAGIAVECAWANVANNVCQKNTTGIDVAGGSDNVIVNNSCNDNATGMHVAGAKNMILSNVVAGNSTAGIASAGMANNYLYNKLGGAAANAADFEAGGSGDNIIAFGSALPAAGQNYFYPPLIDNQHGKPITNGKGRTDLTIASTTLADVQAKYDAARTANPNDVIVLHLNGTFTVGAAPLSLASDTAVLLAGTIQINASTTATGAISIQNAQRVSVSGGTIDGSSLNGHAGIDDKGSSMVHLDKVTIQNLGDNTTGHPGSDSIFINNTVTPTLVTRCTITKSGNRGIWSATKGKTLYADNDISGTRAGIDCDASTFGAVMMFNTATSNTYGFWYEQSATHNVGIGNLSQNNVRNQLDQGNLDHVNPTAYNSYICNKAIGGLGFTSSAGGTMGIVTLTSHNFAFNNVLMNASFRSNPEGSENYFSQNIQNGGSFTASGTAETFFNPAAP